jgi:uncharacterized UBP type Zn finger protein
MVQPYGVRMAQCTHLESIELTELPASVEGCEDCLPIGGKWCHLRICLTCGHIGCCDSSPNQHATAHSKSSGHPLVRSIQPGEEWLWCYEDEVMPRGREVPGETRIPTSPLCP